MAKMTSLLYENVVTGALSCTHCAVGHVMASHSAADGLSHTQRAAGCLHTSPVELYVSGR